MTREPYPGVRVRPLQLLSWVVVSIGVVMVLLAVVYLLAGADPGAVLLLLLLPALLMTGLAAWSISLLTRNHRRARLTVPATGAVTVLVGIMYSRIGPPLICPPNKNDTSKRRSASSKPGPSIERTRRIARPISWAALNMVGASLMVSISPVSGFSVPS